MLLVLYLIAMCPVLSERLSLGREAEALPAFSPATVLSLLATSGPGLQAAPGVPLSLCLQSPSPSYLSANNPAYVPCLEHQTMFASCCSSTPFSTSAGPLPGLLPLSHLQLTQPPCVPLLPTAAASSLSSPSSYCPSPTTPLLQLLLVAYCVEAGVVRRRVRLLRLRCCVRCCGGGDGCGAVQCVLTFHGFASLCCTSQLYRQFYPPLIGGMTATSSPS